VRVRGVTAREQLRNGACIVLLGVVLNALWVWWILRKVEGVVRGLGRRE